MNIIRKCKAILRIKSKSNSAISVKDRAMAVLEHDLRQAESAYAKNITPGVRTKPCHLMDNTKTLPFSSLIEYPSSDLSRMRIQINKHLLNS